MAKTLPARMCVQIKNMIEDERRGILEYSGLYNDARKLAPVIASKFDDIVSDERKHRVVLTAIFNAKCRR